MGLSCACDDFDKGEYETWWEAPYQAIPPTGSTCCECDAPLPAERTQAFDHMEVYEPDEPMPPYPDDVMVDEPSCHVLARHWDGEYDRMEAARAAWEDERGYDSDYERFERVSRTDYRCERCADLATALDGDEDEGGLGYCMVAPGELISAHSEYVEQSGGREVIWKRDDAGVLHPQRMTQQDFAERELHRRLRRAHYPVDATRAKQGSRVMAKTDTQALAAAIEEFETEFPDLHWDTNARGTVTIFKGDSKIVAMHIGMRGEHAEAFRKCAAEIHSERNRHRISDRHANLMDAEYGPERAVQR